MASFEQIQTFLEVARARSFIQAALKLNIPRSTVTARINALEDRLNTRLLHRTTRSVSLTDEGKRYFSGCASAVDNLARVEDDLTSGHAPIGPIRISVPLDFPKRQLADLMGEFLGIYPGISFQIHVSDVPVDMVAEAYDIALRGRRPGNDSLIARKLNSDPLVLLAPTDADLDETTAKTLDSLAIIDPTGLVRPAYTTSPAPGGLETGNFEMAVAIAQRCGMYLILPDGLASQEIAAGRFRAVTPPEPLPEIALFYVLPSRDFVPHRVRLFADFLATRLKS
jgi:DNA-binding transcriptional LysR family regulator